MAPFVIAHGLVLGLWVRFENDRERLRVSLIVLDRKLCFSENQPIRLHQLDSLDVLLLVGLFELNQSDRQLMKQILDNDLRAIFLRNLLLANKRPSPVKLQMPASFEGCLFGQD